MIQSVNASRPPRFSTLNAFFDNGSLIGHVEDLLADDHVDAGSGEGCPGYITLNHADPI